MIQKLVRIKNVGKFKDCRAAGNVDFRKLTLIYAENGRGKTTLCDILRSLQTGSPDYIRGRTTLTPGTPDEPELNIRLESDNARFTSGAWTLTHSDTAIYDATFVHENVHAGDCVDHDQKRNLYDVIVGAVGVALKRQVEDLDTQSREAAKRLREARTAVTRLVPEGIGFDTFIGLAKENDIDAKIGAKTKEVAALRQANEIAVKNALTTITLPEIPGGFEETLGKTLDDVSADAEARVRKHLKEDTDNATEAWLSEGLQFTSEEVCPFCAQDLSGIALIDAYRDYFAASYTNLKQEISSLEENISGPLGEDALLAVQKAIADNAALWAFWREFVSGDEPAGLSFDELRGPLTGLRDAALRCVRAKQASPLEPMGLDPGLEEAKPCHAAALDLVRAYNDAAHRVNSLIAEKKASTETGELAAAQDELALLEASRGRYTTEAGETCDEYFSATKDKEEFEADKAAAKAKLEQHADAVFGPYQKRINELLDMFGAGFRIINTKSQYPGGTPRSSYQLVINDVAVDIGHAKTPIDKISFKNTLSSGDRSTLALAFFLAQAERDPELSKKTLVFDDPFSSQDRSRRTCTQQRIAKLCERAKQVVVLSHEPAFLSLFVDAYPRAAEVRCLQLMRLGADDTTVTECDLREETRGDYFKDHGALTKYLAEGAPDATGRRHVARSIRLVLEGYLRFKLPHQFGATDWLGEMIAKIRNADAGTPLGLAQKILDELTDLNDYSKKYHHDQNPSANTEPVDDGELRTYAKRAIELVGGF